MATTTTPPARGDLAHVTEHDAPPRRALPALRRRAPPDAAGLYLDACRRLGLDPATHPLVVVRRRGEPAVCATRHAADQLAARHKLRREIVDGPRVFALDGKDVAYALCRASHPDGRVATAGIAVPLADPVNALMSCETRAKRLATLRVLGLESLQGPGETPGAQVDPAHVPPAPRVAGPAAPQAMSLPPPALASFLSAVAALTRPADAVALWLQRRDAVAQLPAPVRSAAWSALCQRTRALGGMADPAGWLKHALAWGPPGPQVRAR